MSELFIFFVVSFFSGSIPFGYMVGFLKGIDVRKSGSGNIGATNVSRVLGKKYGLVVLLLDALKGFIPVYFAYMYGFSEFVQIVCGVLAIAGHCFSPFLSFRGGKGVATSLGAFLFISPAAIFVAIVIFIFIVALTGYVSAGSVVCAAVFPFVFYILGSKSLSCIFPVVFASLVVILKHRENIKRIIKGEERKFR